MNIPVQQLGIIALDIDGTLTVDHHPIEPDVVTYLNSLFKSGWSFIFITGRTFSRGYEVLKTIPFPYYFAAQNGSIIIEMPSRRIVSKKYLSRTVIPLIEEICKDEPSDFVMYTGFENRDLCYYRPAYFDQELLKYLKERTEMFNETWQEIQSFDDMLQNEFSSIKCFGKYASASRIAKRIETELNLHIPLIRDPFNRDYYVAQATHPEADKGLALSEIVKNLPKGSVSIAAGDDHNDVSMLNVASLKVVMDTAPKELLAMADIIAPSAKEKGIIVGLKQAIEIFSNKGWNCNSLKV